jgi:hypothetical protein
MGTALAAETVHITANSMEYVFLQKLIVAYVAKKLVYFSEVKGSLPFSQQSATIHFLVS